MLFYWKQNLLLTEEKKVKLIGLLAMMVFCVLLESEAGVLITYTMELLIIVQIRN